MTFRGERRAGYWSTLGRAYLLYSFSTCLGLAAMYWAVDLARLDHRLSWLATTAGTSLVNFLVLRRMLVLDPEGER